MKNVFRKAAAAVMAFTLLGVGTTFTKPISADMNTITASAAAKTSSNPPHNHGQFTYSVYEKEDMYKITKYDLIFGIKMIVSSVHYHFEWNVVRCKVCDKVVSKTIDDRSYVQYFYYSLGKCTNCSPRMKI